METAGDVTGRLRGRRVIIFTLCDAVPAVGGMWRGRHNKSRQRGGAAVQGHQDAKGETGETLVLRLIEIWIIPILDLSCYVIEELLANFFARVDAGFQ